MVWLSLNQTGSPFPLFSMAAARACPLREQMLKDDQARAGGDPPARGGGRCPPKLDDVRQAMADDVETLTAQARALQAVDAAPSRIQQVERRLADPAADRGGGAPRLPARAPMAELAAACPGWAGCRPGQPLVAGDPRGDAQQRRDYEEGRRNFRPGVVPDAGHRGDAACAQRATTPRPRSARRAARSAGRCSSSHCCTWPRQGPGGDGPSTRSSPSGRPAFRPAAGLIRRWEARPRWSRSRTSTATAAAARRAAPAAT